MIIASGKDASNFEITKSHAHVRYKKAMAKEIKDQEKKLRDVEELKK